MEPVCAPAILPLPPSPFDPHFSGGPRTNISDMQVLGKHVPILPLLRDRVDKQIMPKDPFHEHQF